MATQQTVPVHEKIRDTTWDIARGVGMSLVIYGHFLEPLYPARPEMGRELVQSAFSQWQVIYSFHMMLFFLVSGAVNKSLTKKPLADVVRGSVRLLALAWLVHLMGVAVNLVRGDMPAQPLEAWKQALDPLLEGFCWSIGVVWFLTSLCFVQILAYLLLKRLPAWGVVGGAMLATFLVVFFDAPNQYLFRTWMPGLSFFALGYWLSRLEIKWNPWLCIPLFVATIILAPMNDGCAYTLHDACARWSGPFGVRMFGGNYGSLPLFFLTSLTGALSVVCLSRGLSQFKYSSLFAYAGRNSLDLFIINGVVATYLPPLIARLDATHFGWYIYLTIAVLVIGLHLAAQVVLRRPLAWLDGVALRMATLVSSVGMAKPTAVTP